MALVLFDDAFNETSSENVFPTSSVCTTTTQSRLRTMMQQRDNKKKSCTPWFRFTSIRAGDFPRHSASADAPKSSALIKTNALLTRASSAAWTSLTNSVQVIKSLVRLSPRTRPQIADDATLQLWIPRAVGSHDIDSIHDGSSWKTAHLSNTFIEFMTLPGAPSTTWPRIDPTRDVSMERMITNLDAAVDNPMYAFEIPETLLVPVVMQPSRFASTFKWLSAARTVETTWFHVRPRVWVHPPAKRDACAIVHVRNNVADDPSLVLEMEQGMCANVRTNVAELVPNSDKIAVGKATEDDVRWMREDDETQDMLRKLDALTGFFDRVNGDACSFQEASAAAAHGWPTLFSRIQFLANRVLSAPSHLSSPLSPLIGDTPDFLQHWATRRLCFSAPFEDYEGGTEVLDTMLWLTAALWFDSSPDDDSMAHVLTLSPDRWKEDDIQNARFNILDQILHVDVREPNDNPSDDISRLLQSLKVLVVSFLLHLCSATRQTLENAANIKTLTCRELSRTHTVFQGCAPLLMTLAVAFNAQRFNALTADNTEYLPYHVDGLSALAHPSTYLSGVLADTGQDAMLRNNRVQGLVYVKELRRIIYRWRRQPYSPYYAHASIPHISSARTMLLYLHASTFRNSSDKLKTTHDCAEPIQLKSLAVDPNEHMFSTIYARHIMIENYVGDEKYAGVFDKDQDKWKSFLDMSHECMLSYRTRDSFQSMKVTQDILSTFPQKVQNAYLNANSFERRDSLQYALQIHLLVLKTTIELLWETNIFPWPVVDHDDFVMAMHRDVMTRDVNADSRAPLLATFASRFATDPMPMGVSFLLRGVDHHVIEFHAVFIVDNIWQHFWIMMLRSHRVSRALSAMFSESLAFLAVEMHHRNAAWKPTASWAIHAFTRRLHAFLKQGKDACYTLLNMFAHHVDAGSFSNPITHFEQCMSKARAMSFVHAVGLQTGISLQPNQKVSDLAQKNATLSATAVASLRVSTLVCEIDSEP